MKDVIIFGAGGLGRDAHQTVEDLNQDGGIWNFVGFLDANSALHKTEVHGFPVLGNTEWLRQHANTSVVIAIGSPVVRRKIVSEIASTGDYKFPTLRHPRAWIANRVEIAPGTLIFAGAMITTDVKIGHHSILGRNSTVGHDAVLEDYVSVSPSADINGGVHIGTGCALGTSCTIIQGLSVGCWSIIGAGAVVVADLPPNVTAVGAPARRIKTRPEGWHQTSET